LEAKALETLIQEGENSTVEFKVAVPRYAELAERMCGMANSLGGYLIIGVVDKTWNIVGVKNVADTIDTILQASRHCKPAVRLEPQQPQIVEV
jgi:predicted HTH transcriptional regulator